MGEGHWCQVMDNAGPRKPRVSLRAIAKMTGVAAGVVRRALERGGSEEGVFSLRTEDEGDSRWGITEDGALL